MASVMYSGLVVMFVGMKISMLMKLNHRTVSRYSIEIHHRDTSSRPIIKRPYRAEFALSPVPNPKPRGGY
jgi:hypothetical protein